MKRIVTLLLALCMLCMLCACTAKPDAETQARIDALQSRLEAVESRLDGGAAADVPADDKSAAGEVDAAASNFVRQTKEGTLTIGTCKEIDSFDPARSTFSTGIYLVYDQLFYLDQDGNIQGMLAEEWEYQDPTHLYIKIHEANFSNGDPVTAEDCIWSMQRLILNQSRWSTFVDFIDFDNCEIINDREFVLALKQEFGPGMNYLATRYTSVLNKEYVEATGDDALWDQPVGSGPYVCTSNVSGSISTFERRDDYWDADNLPEAEEITVRFYAESTTMFIDYENGVLDMAFVVGESDAERLVAGEIADTGYVIQSGLDVYGLALPEYVSAFDDLRVREAISMAVDWKAVTEVGLGVLGGEADSILPHGVVYRISTGTYNYDPDQAKALLDEAGFDYSQVFQFVVVNSESNTRLAEAIQAYLAAVGIQVNVDACDWTTAVTHFMNNETDFVINSMGCTTLDPDQQFDTVGEWSTNGSVRVTDPEMAGYLTTGRYSSDPAVREKAYADAQTWMYENIRQVAFAEPYYCYCYRPYIDGSFWCAAVETPNLRFVQFVG